MLSPFVKLCVFHESLSSIASMIGQLCHPHGVPASASPPALSSILAPSQNLSKPSGTAACHRKRVCVQAQTAGMPVTQHWTETCCAPCLPHLCRVSKDEIAAAHELFLNTLKVGQSATHKVQERCFMGGVGCSIHIVQSRGEGDLLTRWILSLLSLLAATAWAASTCHMPTHACNKSITRQLQSSGLGHGRDVMHSTAWNTTVWYLSPGHVAICQASTHKPRTEGTTRKMDIQSPMQASPPFDVCHQRSVSQRRSPPLPP